jgi:hypothetical protein
MSDKLKPCPFCGGVAKFFIHTSNFGKSWGSRKDLIKVGYSNKNCLAQPFINAIEEDREKTAEAWNTRSKNER